MTLHSTVHRGADAIASLPSPADYDAGARNAIEVCLSLQPHETCTLITDEACLAIAASLARHARATGATVHAFVLEDFGARPMTAMPEPILEALRVSHVSMYACRTQTGELPHRIAMTAVVNERRIRHGHMVNINHQIMLEGMRADFHAVDALSTRVIARAREARRITAKTPAGTDIEVTLSPELRWLKTSGIISPDKWGNLPGGEIFTSPVNVEGVFVVDGVVGDYLCEKYGDLRETPLTIEIEHSRIRACRCDNRMLLDEFIAYCMTDENSNRVGEFAIGTNTALTRVIGHILQDEKLPGVHIAFGHPYAEHTGADWKSTTHIDVVGRDFDIWIEDERIMERGRFLI